MANTTYCVKISDYYRGFDPAVGVQDSIAGNDNIAMCEAAIRQLVDRYELAGKDTLSIGAGRAFEEYWMGKAGCRLTLVDLDLDTVARLEEHLLSLPRTPAGPETLSYVIGDALEYCKSAAFAKFGVLYVSSLHPDEIRREEIQKTFIAERTEAARQSYLTWPRGSRPYSQYITAGWSLIADGGLAIMQHYRGGVDVVMQPHYLDDMQDQMAEFGLALLEAWCFRQSPQHLLVIAVKGGHEHVSAWEGRLASRPPITTFHGRYPDASIKNDVIKIFPRSREEKLNRNMPGGATVSSFSRTVKQWLFPTR